MDHKCLLDHCVAVLESYQPDLQAIDDHVNKYLKFTAISDEGDQTFIQEVFSGCARYSKVVDVVVDNFYKTHGKRVLKTETTLYRVLCYLTLFRLDELGMVHYRNIIRTQDVNRMYRFLNFQVDEKNLLTWMKDAWSHLYDATFVQTTLLSPVQRWLPELQDMMDQMKEKIDGKQPEVKKVLKKTEPKPFNLTQPKPRTIPIPEPIPKLAKHKAVPVRGKEEPAENTLIQEAKERNRRLAEERLIEASRTQFACANTEKSDKTKRKIGAIIAEENSKLQFDKTKSNSLPPTLQNAIPVKLTAAQILREGAHYKKKEEEVIKKLEALEAGAKDASDFLQWQTKMRTRDMDEDIASLERKRLEGKISHEEAILSRQKIAQENRRKVEMMREEAKEKMAELLQEKLEEEEEMRRLVENVLDTRSNARESRKKLQEYKHKIVQQMHEESKELMAQALEEAEADMRRKVELIKEIRALEAVPANRPKLVDLASSAGHGFLSEMSIVELNERLSWLKQYRRVEEDDKRDSILSTKHAKDIHLMDTLSAISKHRQEKTRSAALKLEEKKQKHGLRPEVTDTQLVELQRKLEDKRAERRQAQRSGRLVPTRDSAKRTATLIREKHLTETNRWEELERSKEKKAHIYQQRIAQSQSARRLLAPSIVS